jgi:hypothetical protein
MTKEKDEKMKICGGGGGEAGGERSDKYINVVANYIEPIYF